jgi:hypothetical protein
MTPERLVPTFAREGVEIQALYRKRSQADPGPVVDARPRAVALARISHRRRVTKSGQ